MELTHVTGRLITIPPLQVRAVSESENIEVGCEVLIGEKTFYSVKESYEHVCAFLRTTGVI